MKVGDVVLCRKLYAIVLGIIPERMGGDLVHVWSPYFSGGPTKTVRAMSLTPVSREEAPLEIQLTVNAIECGSEFARNPFAFVQFFVEAKYPSF